MKYLAKFVGRKRLAAGVFYHIEAEVEGEDEKQAEMKLYENYDHIMWLKLTPLDGENVEGETDEVRNDR